LNTIWLGGEENEGKTDPQNGGRRKTIGALESPPEVHIFFITVF
jgi:hypothetical protein